MSRINILTKEEEKVFIKIPKKLEERFMNAPIKLLGFIDNKINVTIQHPSKQGS